MNNAKDVVNDIFDEYELHTKKQKNATLAELKVLAIKPKYLILDEPVAGLDPIGRTRFMHLIRKLNKDGMTIIMVSHNADAIAECTDSLFIMRNGSILCSGNTRKIAKPHDATIPVKPEAPLSGGTRALPLIRHNKIVPTLLERIESDEQIKASKIGRASCRERV